MNRFITSPDVPKRPIEKVDVAAALIALKNRHCLSAVCINDICSLLSKLNVPNAPRSWFRVKQALNQSIAMPLSRTIMWICPVCKKASDNQFICSNRQCKWRLTPPSPVPNHFYIFNIIEQISAILSTTTDLQFPKPRIHSPRSKAFMSDIVDGSHYCKLLNEEDEPFLTLTLSTDGIQPHKSADKSIWPVTLIINEIKRKKRFCYQNLILAGVWPGPTKPKRFEMFAFLETIVLQLKELEKGFLFECRSDSNSITRILKVFLICATMDKPAQALVQNLPEPTAQFGCNRCEIRGKYFYPFTIIYYS